MRLLPAAARTSEPWRNGSGRTALVADSDGWRVSIAQLSDSSPFSAFPGAGRLLMALSASGVVLSINGRRLPCRRLEACSFDGEDAVFALDVTEPLQVLNLIWQRRACRGRLTSVAVDGPLELRCDGIAAVAIAVSGSCAVIDGAQLGLLDGLSLAGGERVTVSGRGELVLARIEAVGR